MIRHTTNLFLMGSLLTCGVGATAIAGTLEEAVSAYQSALQSSDRDERMIGFQRAELLFRKAIEDSDGTANAELYANLGTTCLSAERLGPAIVAYRRALQIEPTHTQSQKNLQHARKLLPAWSRPNENSSPLDMLRWQHSRRTFTTASAVCFCLGCVAIAAAINWRIGFLKMLAIFPLGAWVLFSVALTVVRPNTMEAVIVRDDVVARSADSHNSSQLFGGPLPSGAEVEVVAERGDWAKISFAERTAWVPRSALEIISQPPSR